MCSLHKATVVQVAQEVLQLPSLPTDCSLAVSDTGLVEEEPDWDALNDTNDSNSAGESAGSARTWQSRFIKVKAKGRKQMQVCMTVFFQSSAILQQNENGDSVAEVAVAATPRPL